MILLAVFGGLIFILGCFYLANSWQQYRQWKLATLLVLVSLAVTVYGVVNLPYWHHNTSAVSSSASSQASAKTASSSKTGSNSISGFSNSTALSSSTSNMSQEQKEAAVLKQLQSSYSKFGSVAYDSSSKTYQIDPSSGNEADALKYLAENPSKASEMGWSSLTDSLDQVSAQLVKTLGDGYSLSLMNPNDTSQVMYTTKNGNKTYDIADQ